MAKVFCTPFHGTVKREHAQVSFRFALFPGKYLNDKTEAVICCPSITRAEKVFADISRAAAEGLRLIVREAHRHTAHKDPTEHKRLSFYSYETEMPQ